MGSIDGLREQVEELKQRLNGPGTQHGSEPDELKTRLASIKAGLESKQGEIAQLSTEKKRLTAEKEQLAAEKQQLAAEKQQLLAENEQLHKMLSEVLAAIDGKSSDASANILSEFLAETGPLIESAGEASKGPRPAQDPAGQTAANPVKAQVVEAGSRQRASRPAGAAPNAAGQETPPPQGPSSDGGEADEEESPALRRIMKRGRRAG